MSGSTLLLDHENSENFAQAVIEFSRNTYDYIVVSEQKHAPITEPLQRKTTNNKKQKTITQTKRIQESLPTV